MKWILQVCKKLTQSFYAHKLAVLSGVLIGTSWIPFPPWALLFCMIPLWWQLSQETSLKSAFWAGWWTQFVLTLIGFFWIAYVTVVFGYMHWTVGGLVLLLFASFIHLHYAFASLIIVALKNKFRMGASWFFVLCAGIYSIAEWVWPAIFPWNLAYPLMATGASWVQWADVVGMLGLSFFVLLTNAGILIALKQRTQIRKLAAFFFVILFLTLTWFLGAQRISKWQTTDTHLKALVVQANIGNLEKIYAEKGWGYQQFILDRFTEMTKKGIEQFGKSDLIIWPETAFPDVLDSFNHGRSYVLQLKELAQSIQTPILTGAYSKDHPGTSGRSEYNAVFLMNPMGALESPPYRKTHLLIFGEYVPFAKDYKWIAKYNPAGSGFGTGSGPTTLSYKDTKMGIQICYEGLYPRFSQSLAQLGAHIFVNVTNDSWFGPWSEPYQHMYMTLSRAIENRRPLIRSTNTGISTVVLASGEILQQGPLHQPWVHQFEIPFQKNPEQTFYSKFGQWMWLLPATAVFLSIFLAGTAKKD